jgi:hypothetical protein
LLELPGVATLALHRSLLRELPPGSSFGSPDCIDDTEAKEAVTPFGESAWVPALVVSLGELPGDEEELLEEVLLAVSRQPKAGISNRGARELLEIGSVNNGLPEHHVQVRAMTQRLPGSQDTTPTRGGATKLVPLLVPT